MKRLILMGGRPWEARDKGQYFTDVLFRYTKTEVKLAFCIFAQPESDWAATAKRNKQMFQSFASDCAISYRTMTAENFDKVSSWADIIYLPGGSPAKLLKLLQAHGDIREKWDGKIIAGSSAGADLFCRNFVYLQDKSFGQGLDWILATCIPHWRDNFENYTEEDWNWAEREAIKRFPDVPVLCIPEGTFVEYTVA